MGRLIDADALLDCVQERLRNLKRKTARLSDIVAEVNTQPTIQQERIAQRISVAPFSSFKECSKCGFANCIQCKYCPDCGAKFVEAE